MHLSNSSNALLVLTALCSALPVPQPASKALHDTLSSELDSQHTAVTINERGLASAAIINAGHAVANHKLGILQVIGGSIDAYDREQAPQKREDSKVAQPLEERNEIANAARKVEDNVKKAGEDIKKHAPAILEVVAGGIDAYTSHHKREVEGEVYTM